MASPPEEDSLLGQVGALIARPPVTCAAHVPLREALETMHRSMVGSVVITTAEGVPEASSPSAICSGSRPPESWKRARPSGAS